MKYAYIRVSTKSQNIDRQYLELSKYVTKNNIFIDRESGKDFKRLNYQKLRQRLTKGDELYIKSIDRLGRNYNLMTEEFRYLAKEKGVIVYILDMPFISSFNNDSIDKTLRTFIIDVILQILSFVAENERKNIKERQKEGIKIAKMQGKHLGRPRINITDDFKDIVHKVNNKNIKLREALKILNISKTTFYKYKKKIT